MNGLNSQVLFQRWKENAWEFFISIENSFKIKYPFHFPQEKPYIDVLFHLVYYGSHATSLESDQVLQFAVFIALLMKSTLLFDEAFFLPMHQKEAKMALMQGDLYLVQGGIEFSKLQNYQYCQKLLDQTLKNISSHYEIMQRSSVTSETIIKNIAKRYGSIFYCSISGLLLLNQLNSFNQKMYKSLSEFLAINITLKHHSPFSFSTSSSYLSQTHQQLCDWNKKYAQASCALRLTEINY